MNKELFKRIRKSYSDYYFNENLEAEITEQINKDTAIFNELRERYDATSDVREKNRLVDLANEIKCEIDLLNEALSKEQSKPIRNKKKNKTVASETGATVASETESKNPEKKSGAGFFIAGVLTTALVVGLAGVIINPRKVDQVAPVKNTPAITATAQPQATKTPEVTPESTPEVLDGSFVDASNEEQIRVQAQAIYDEYVNREDMPEATKAVLSVETIENMLRMCNGEFALDNGNVDYTPGSSDAICKVANDMDTYYNSTSFAQYKTNLVFKPCAPFFEEGSIARKIAERHDELLEKIYTDIRNNDVESFQEDSVEWGEFVRDTFIFNDSKGDVTSIWQVDTEQQYQLASAIISPYGCSIMEYSIAVDLARRDSKTGMLGDTFGICIPYCYNEQSELEYIPLSKLIYDIQETPMNDLAARAGQLGEWQANNAPIMVQLGLDNMELLDAKYNNEIGQSKRLS